LQIGNFGFVELLKHTDGEQTAQHRRARHHDVVAGFSGEQFRFDDLVGIERVVADLDAGFPGEVFQHLRVDIVRPVIDVDDFLLRKRRSADKREQKRAEFPVPDRHRDTLEDQPGES
jgi:hypothetical protein